MIEIEGISLSAKALWCIMLGNWFVRVSLDIYESLVKGWNMVLTAQTNEAVKFSNRVHCAQ